MIGNRVWTLSQDDSHIFCHQHPLGQDSPTPQEEKTKRTNSRNRSRSHCAANTTKTSERGNNTETFLSTEKIEPLMNDYFQLDVSLEKMYALWSKADQNFAHVSPQFPGVRMLNQDPVENVFSFICSSNNNIQRYNSYLCDRDIGIWYRYIFSVIFQRKLCIWINGQTILRIHRKKRRISTHASNHKKISNWHLKHENVNEGKRLYSIHPKERTILFPFFIHLYPILSFPSQNYHAGGQTL